MLEEAADRVLNERLVDVAPAANDAPRRENDVVLDAALVHQDALVYFAVLSDVDIVHDYGVNYVCPFADVSVLSELRPLHRSVYVRMLSHNAEVCDAGQRSKSHVLTNHGCFMLRPELIVWDVRIKIPFEVGSADRSVGSGAVDHPGQFGLLLYVHLEFSRVWLLRLHVLHHKVCYRHGVFLLHDKLLKHFSTHVDIGGLQVRAELALLLLFK